jgi:cell wall assembly regulator SMI1
MTWLLIVFAVVGVGSWFAISSLRRASYPVATMMPSPPTESLSGILQQLDSQIETHSPKTFASLRPGLSHDELVKIESKYDLRLTKEIRELYEWHDGLSVNSGTSFFGVHQFPPLEHLAQSRQAMAQGLSDATGLQRGVYWLLCGHRKNWIELFPDGAGDGYFVDPTRNPNQGAVFYNFNETGDYQFYPTLSSLMMAISACYEAEIYDDSNDAASISAIEKEQTIHQTFSASKSP